MAKTGTGEVKAPRSRRSKAVEVDETALAAIGAPAAEETPSERRSRWLAHYRAAGGMSAADAAARYREDFPS